jgi:hypothetical protein
MDLPWPVTYGRQLGGSTVLNAMLLAVIRLLETVVNWSLGAALIVIGIVGTGAASRWIISEGIWDRPTDGTLLAPRRGAQSITLAAVLAFGFGCVLAGMALWTR